MTNEDAKVTIQVLQDFYKISEYTSVPLNEEESQALDKAIASLEAWDKVKKEIKEIKTTDVNRCKTMAVHIINKHLKEK